MSRSRKNFGHEVVEDMLHLTGGSLNFTASTIERLNESIERVVKRRRDTFAKRYPTITSVVAILGITLTFYGIEQLVERVSLFADRPVVILVVGIILLVVTGRLIKQSYVD